MQLQFQIQPYSRYQQAPPSQQDEKYEQTSKVMQIRKEDTMLAGPIKILLRLDFANHRALQVILKVLVIVVLMGSVHSATIFMTLTTTNTSVAAISNYTIAFNRSLNALAQPITPTLLASNYIVSIIFASSYRLSSININPAPSAVSSNSVTLNLSSPINTITITSFTNPLPSETPLPITLNFYNASAPNALVDTASASLTFQVLSLLSGSISYEFSPGNVSTPSNLSLSLIPFVWQSSEMTLSLNLLSYWRRNMLNISSNQVLSSMSYCSPSCSIQSLGGFFVVTINTISLTNGSLRLNIFNILAPATLEAADTISISIVENTYDTDVQTGTLTVSAKYPNNLQVLTPATSNQVGQTVVLAISLLSQGLFSSSDTIIITLNTSLSMAAQVTISNPLVSSFTAQVQQSYMVTLNTFTLVTSIPSQFSGTITISNITAQSSTRPITANTISFYRNGALYDQSQFSFRVSPAAVSSLSLSLSNNNANAVANLTVSAVLSVGLVQGDFAYLRIPQQIQVSDCRVVSCSSCSCMITGANSSAGVLFSGVKVSSFGVGTTSTVTMILGVKNPIASGYLLDLATTDANNYTKQSGNVAYPTITQSTINSSVFSLQSTSNTVYSNTNFTISLNLTQYSLVDGFMKIQFDPAIVLLDPTAPFCLLNSGSSGCTVSFSTFIYLTLTVAHSTSIYIVTLNNLRNPPSSKPYSFKVTLTDQSSRTYYTLTSPFYLASQPMLLTPTVSSSNCTNSQSNLITISFQYLPFTPTTASVIDDTSALLVSEGRVLRTIDYPLNFNKTLQLAIVNSYSMEPVYYQLIVTSTDLLYKIFKFSFTITNCEPNRLQILSYLFTGLPEDPGTLSFTINQVLTTDGQGRSIRIIKYVDVLFPNAYSSSVNITSNAASTVQVSPRLFRLTVGDTQPISLAIWGFTSVLSTTSFQISTFASSQAATNLTFQVSHNTDTVKYNLSALTNCTPYCKICSSINSSACRQCYSQGTTQYYVLDTTTDTCVSRDQCPNATYLNSLASTCLPCPATCSSCSSLSNCSSCSNNYYLLNFSCLTDCPDTYYPVSVQQVCKSCSGAGHCIRCLSMSECLSCEFPYVLQPANRLCLNGCNSGQVVINSTCFNCNSLCKTCSNSTETCTTCNSGYYLYLNQCLSSCPAPFVPQNTNNVCVSCSTSCLTCTDTPNTCTSCAPPLKLINSSCLNDCPPAYYTISLPSGNHQCLQCSSPCLNCSSSTICSSCKPNFFFYNQSCFYSCPSTTYAVNVSALLCLPCLTFCLRCSNGTSCEECQPGYYLSVGLNSTACVSSCGVGQFLSGSTCVSCSSNCIYCVSLAVCLACAETTFLQSSQCILSCQSGYAGVVSTFTFLGSNMTTKKCSSCGQLFSNCGVCTAANCTRCSTGYVLTVDKNCLITCPYGYLNVSSSCISCNSECMGCTTYLYNCTKCVSGVYLYYNSTTELYRCLVECPTSTFRAVSTCVPCLSPCLTCINQSSNCSSCISGFYSLVLSTNLSCVSLCPSNSYTYQSKCILCGSDCIACDAQGCRQCGSSYYQDEGIIVNNITYYTCFISCPSNLPYLKNRTCTKCATNCVTCNSTNCLQCNSGLVSYNQYCLSQCPPTLAPIAGICVTVENNSSSQNGSASTVVAGNKVAPVPFSLVTIGAWVCVLISKYIHSETVVSVAVFAILSVIAVICDLFYMLRATVPPESGSIDPYTYILIIGVIVNYINNVIFLFMSRHTLFRDPDFILWKRGNVHIVKQTTKEEVSHEHLEDHLNEQNQQEEVPQRLFTYKCFWMTTTIIGLFTSHNLYTLIFSKLFGLSLLKAYLRTVRTFYFLNYIWVSSLVASLCCFVSGIILAASISTADSDYTSSVYEATDLTFVNFVALLLGFLLLRKKKEIWTKEQSRSNGSDEQSTKKVIFQRQNNDFDINNLVESQEEVNGKIQNLFNQDNLCQEGVREQSNKSSTNEIDSDLFFEKSQAEDLDNSTEMKLEQNNVFMQILPEEMVPQLIEKDHDQQNLEAQNSLAISPSKVHPNALSPEKEMEVLNLDDLEEQTSEKQSQPGGKDQVMSIYQKQVESKEEQGWVFDDAKGQRTVFRAKDSSQKGEFIVAEGTLRTEGNLLPIQEDETETNKDAQRDSEDDKLYQDEKTIPYAAEPIRPDTSVTLTHENLSLKQIDNNHNVKDQQEQIDNVERKEVRTQQARRNKQGNIERIEQRRYELNTDYKRRHSTKQQQSARISGLKDMFRQVQAVNSPTAKAIQPSSQANRHDYSEHNRYESPREAIKQRLAQNQVRMSSSAHNLKNMMKEQQQMMFDDRIETIRADQDQRQPQRYNFRTVSKEQGRASESSNTKSIYKSINIAKINNRLGSKMTDRPSKIELRAISRQSMRPASQLMEHRIAKSAVREFSTSLRKDKLEKGLTEAGKKQVWMSRAVGSNLNQNNLSGTAQTIERKSKLANNKASLEHIYMSRV